MGLYDVALLQGVRRNHNLNATLYGAGKDILYCRVVLADVIDHDGAKIERVHRNAHDFFLKRAAFVAAWDEVRERLSRPAELGFTVGGKKMKHLEPDKSVKVRRRYGDPDVALMCGWVDDALNRGAFPMHGKQKSWKEAVILFGEQYPRLASRWTADSMRKAYQHFKSK